MNYKNIILIFVILILNLSLINNVNAGEPSIAGPSGLFLTPSPSVSKTGTFSGSLYLENYSVQRASVNNERRFIINGLYGVSPNAEIGFRKLLDTMNSSYDPGLSLNIKYLFPDSKALRVACGLVIETDNNSYSSAYMVAGQDIAYFGLGVNFGGHRAYPLNKAHYGSYDFSDMAPNTFFFVAGANFDLKVANFTVEYNSDAFSLGLKVPTAEGFNVNLAYISNSDYDLVYKNVFGPSYSSQKVILGISGTF